MNRGLLLSLLFACAGRAQVAPATPRATLDCVGCQHVEGLAAFATGTTVVVQASWSAACKAEPRIAVEGGQGEEACNAVPHERSLVCGNPGCLVAETAAGWKLTLTRAGTYPIQVTFKAKSGEVKVIDLAATAMTPDGADVQCKRSTHPSEPIGVVEATLLAGQTRLITATPLTVWVGGQPCAQPGPFLCPLLIPSTRMDVEVKAGDFSKQMTVDCREP